MADSARDDGFFDQLSDPRFRALTERAQDMIGLLDADLQVRYVSPAVERVLGYSPTDLLSRAALEFCHPEDLSRVRAAFERLLSEPGRTISLTARGRHRQGGYREVEVVAHNLLEDAAVGSIVVNGRDVTALREALVALGESERRFRTLAENARDVVVRYRLQPAPAFEYVSPSVEHITGYTPSEFYLDPSLHVRLIAPEDQPRLLHLISGQGREDLHSLQTLCWVRKDGTRVWIEQQTVLIYDAAGQLTAAEIIGRDVSEKVRLEAQLREARKLEAVGTLAAGIAHDLNNLLMTIFAHTSRLAPRLAGDPNGRASLSAIGDTARRAAALSDQLLAFARKGVWRSAVVDLAQAIEQVEAVLRRILPDSVVLRVERRAHGSRVQCDPTQLDQVLINLALRARDCMPKGGSLTIEVGEPCGGFVELAVEDTGRPIPEAELPHVFEPFFSNDDGAGSSGMGLAVVHGIVQRFGGTITVQKLEPAGTRFAIVLPTTERSVDTKAGASSAPSAVAELGAVHSETILLVEDQRSVREVLAQLLRDAGYRVIEAESGTAALRVHERQPIDLLVTDLVMPEMGGAALLEHLRERAPELPVVCMSGYAGDELDPRALPGRITAFLAKPFEPNELLATLRRLLAPDPDPNR